MQRPRTPEVPDEETIALWYEIGRAHSEAGGGGRLAWKLGLTVVCVVAALVLLSAPVFGTAWAGPFAPVVPIVVGASIGGGAFAWKRLRLRGRIEAPRRLLAEKGLDASRPARDGLGAYYDAQLVLLRCEYEFLLGRGAAKSARLFEESFGFAPEDAFEAGPLSVLPDTEEMRKLREGWETRISSRVRRGAQPPVLGLREDAAYRVFPREMTVPAELATRRAYLEISNKLLVERYGREPGAVPEPLRRRAGRDLREYGALVRKSGRRP
ncbi:hypothetical protein GBA63_15880 [Rubrobacter tropicus]|uniref:Uncharacterized protein n=1 Tax=Rubrobacter tropicus TaxID=2653851 RepID=A0A6G8QC17_9ACTN|nr:hypothetical protein [Rubrobacter tropicus]QIN83961.1 hypothetical protein GBA63_15880 [Rubrobacter tropicus]